MKEKITKEEIDDDFIIDDIVELCPECGEPLIEKMSGVKCSNCDYWFCF